MKIGEQVVGQARRLAAVALCADGQRLGLDVPPVERPRRPRLGDIEYGIRELPECCQRASTRSVRGRHALPDLEAPIPPDDDKCHSGQITTTWGIATHGDRALRSTDGEPDMLRSVREVEPQRTFGRRWSVLLGLSASLSLGAAAAAGAATPAGQPGDLLPDLVQEAPQDIGISRVRGHDLLGFRSAVHNAGDGPLMIAAGRPNTRVRDMAAVQVVTRTDGTTRRVRGVGFLRYVRSPDHSHWHFLPFERYELRREGSLVGLVRDRKSGFCLGDRYRVEPRPVGTVDAPVHVGRCGLAKPARLSLTEGISVGWGDDYPAYLDSQHIDVTNVPAGRYVLVHTVNVHGRILERDRTNNVASRRIELRRAHGRARVRVLPPLPA